MCYSPNMFKRALGVLALVGLFNILLCYQQKKHDDGVYGAVYSQSSVSLFVYIWSIFDEDVQSGTNIPQKATGRYLPAYASVIPIPHADFLRLKTVPENRAPFLKLIFPQKYIRINLLPENQNFLFRLKPF